MAGGNSAGPVVRRVTRCGVRYRTGSRSPDSRRRARQGRLELDGRHACRPFDRPLLAGVLPDPPRADAGHRGGRCRRPGQANWSCWSSPEPAAQSAPGDPPSAWANPSRPGQPDAGAACAESPEKLLSGRAPPLISVLINGSQCRWMMTTSLRMIISSPRAAAIDVMASCCLPRRSAARPEDHP